MPEFKPLLLFLVLLSMASPSTPIKATLNSQKVSSIEVGCPQCQPQPELLIENTYESLTIFLQSQLELEGPIAQLNLTKQLMSEQGFKYRKSLGYRIDKANKDHEELLKEIKAYINGIMDRSKLGWCQLRLADTFTLSYQVSQDSINHLMLSYLHPSKNIDTIRTQHPNLSFQVSNTTNSTTVQVQRRLHGRGFHQQINYTLQIPEGIDIQIDPNQCCIIIEDILPSSTYIDSDQLQSVSTFQTINIQQPAYQSKQYYYRYKVAFNRTEGVAMRRYHFQQYIHFRYPTPKEDTEFTKVYLHPLYKMEIHCEGSANGSGSGNGNVYQVTEMGFVDRRAAMVPTGSLQYNKAVLFVTLTTTMLASFLVSKLIRGIR